MVNISGLDKAKVLKALHDNSKAQGMSFLNLKTLSLEECQEITTTTLYFDYLAGKVLKVDISEDTFESICCAAYEIYILHTIGIDEEYNTTTEDVTEMRLTVDNEVII